MLMTKTGYGINELQATTKSDELKSDAECLYHPGTEI